MRRSGCLYARSYPVNDKISITVPTVGQIWDNEDEYYRLITAVIAAPCDFMVQLDDVGIDFSKISPFELFLSLFNTIKVEDASLVFGGLDLSLFETAVNAKNGQTVLLDHKNHIMIDRAVHGQIRRAIRKINHMELADKKPGNNAARKFMIERARTKQRRAANSPRKSQLEDLIIAMVNTEQFKYGYEGARDLTIYQFHESVHQIIRKINYDNLMIGCYAGNIDSKKLSKEQSNWIITK